MTRNPFKYLFISLIVIAIDQLSKYLVRLLMPNQSISIIGDLFYLTHVQNKGAAFSISLGSAFFNRIFFSIVTVLMIVVILYMLKHSRSFWEKFSYSLIIGGAIGNLIDRLAFGSVTDFFDVDFPDFLMERWPVFNIADSSIVIAITILLIYTIFFESRRKRR